MKTNKTLIVTKVVDPLNGKTEYLHLEEGEKVLLTNTKMEDVTYVFSDKEVNELIKGKAHRPYYNGPLIVAINFPYKKKVYEARIQRFNSLEEIKDWLNNNKGIVVYNVFKRKDKEMYGVRYYDGLRFRCKLEKYYNDLMLAIPFKFENFKKKIKKLYI